MTTPATTATTAVRRRPAPLRATVVRTEKLAPHLVRVTLGGDDLDRFVWPGPAAHLKLMLPADGAADVALPEPDADGTVAFDRTHAATMRTYTARRFVGGELDLDVVLHGDGLASRWAERAAPGDRVAVSRPRAAGFAEEPDADWLVVAGDASALPALATIAEVLTRPATVYAEVDPADRVPLAVPVTWLSPGGLADAVVGHPRPAGTGQVWVAGEAGEIRAIRRALHGEVAHLTTRGYWRAGETNHPDHDYGDDA